MVSVQLREPHLINEVEQAALHEGRSPEDLLQEAVRKYLASYRQKRILAESKVWYQLPADVRNQFVGLFVALYNGEIVDSDKERISLYERIREKYGRQPVLLVEGGDHPMPEYRITNVFVDR